MRATIKTSAGFSHLGLSGKFSVKARSRITRGFCLPLPKAAVTSGASTRVGHLRSFAALELPTNLLQRRIWLSKASAYLPAGLVADQLWQIRGIDAGLAME